MQPDSAMRASERRPGYDDTRWQPESQRREEEIRSGVYDE
jgi:hypothetical protein